VTFALVKPDKGIRKRSARRVSSVSNTTGDDYGIDAPTRAGSGSSTPTPRRCGAAAIRTGFAWPERMAHWLGRARFTSTP